VCTTTQAKRHDLACERRHATPDLLPTPSYRPPHQNKISTHGYEGNARDRLISDRKMYPVQSDMSEPGLERPLLRHKQIDIRMPAQRSLELDRLGERGRAAARHPGSL
jgi:hypothetical protein